MPSNQQIWHNGSIENDNKVEIEEMKMFLEHEHIAHMEEKCSNEEPECNHDELLFKSCKQHQEERLKDQQKNGVWNPRGSKSLRLVGITLLQKSDRPHRRESMKFSFLHQESDAGASCFRKSL